jgi:hypothetical protein
VLVTLRGLAGAVRPPRTAVPLELLGSAVVAHGRLVEQNHVHPTASAGPRGRIGGVAFAEAAVAEVSAADVTIAELCAFVLDG